MTIPKLTAADLERAISSRTRERLIRGDLQTGADVATIRRFTVLSQDEFAIALGVSVRTVRNWEQGRRKPEGPAVALLRVAARHPGYLYENLTSAG